MSLAIAYTWHNRFNVLERLIFIGAIFFAFVFLFFRSSLPPGPDFLIKAMPVIFLALLSLKHIRGNAGLLLCLALLFSAGGDILLEINHRRGGLFVYGLASFLIAHVIYIIVFRQDFLFERSWVPHAALLVVGGLAIAIMLVPELPGGLIFPVMLYMCVIMAMAIMAIFRGRGSMVVFYGALSFVFSDSMIAVNKFVNPVEGARYYIMSSYYLAQFLIIAGFLFDPEYGDDPM